MGTIGEIIKNKRNFLGLSQKALGEKVGVTQTFISEIESGRKNPSLEVLIKICGAFGDEFLIDREISKALLQIAKEEGVVFPSSKKNASDLTTELSSEELSLLEYFRSANERAQGMVLGILMSNQKGSHEET